MNEKLIKHLDGIFSPYEDLLALMDKLTYAVLKGNKANLTNVNVI